MIKKLHAMQQTQIQSLDCEDPLEKEMATDSSILTWEIPWTEEPGALQTVGSKKRRMQLRDQHFHFLSSFTYLPQTTIS